MNSLFLHGALYCAADFDEITARRPEALTLDFHGHGQLSDDERPFSIESFAEQTLRELDTRGIEEVDLFGYSMGGYVGLKLASLAPNRIRTVMTLATKFDWTPESAKREVRMLDPDAIEQKVPAFGTTLQRRHGEDQWKSVLRRTAEMMNNLGDDPELSQEDLESIRVPVRLMVGDRDKMVSIEETLSIYRRLPAAELSVLPNTPHPLERVDPEWLLAEFDRFVNTVRQ